MSKKMAYYAVRVGKKPGIYTSWAECSENINKFSGAIYKKFETLEDANKFMNISNESNNNIKSIEKENKADIADIENKVDKVDKEDKEDKEDKKAKRSKKSKKETEINTTTDLSGLHAYIDGSFSAKHNLAGYGSVILKDGDIIEKLLGSTKKYLDMRNVSGELFAAAYTINWAIEHNYLEVTLHYDYTGIENWARGLWKTNKEGTKNYKEFIDKKKNLIKINFVKVAGHSGDYYNDMADLLAKEGIESTINDN